MKSFLRVCITCCQASIASSDLINIFLTSSKSFLFQKKWRNPGNKVATIGKVFCCLVVVSFPLIHFMSFIHAKPLYPGLYHLSNDFF